MPFFYLGLQTMVFTLHMFSAILEFPHLPCLLLLLPIHLLTPIEKLIFKCLMHRIVQHCACFGLIECRRGSRKRSWGATRESLKPSPCSPPSRLFIRFPQTGPIVETLIFRSPDCHVVRILIVSFPEHQQCNENLQKGCSDGSESVVFLMIKSTKI